ncbi:MAG TPA: pyridoxamine 5'-phosphate oxidase family protein [Candidatus Saccharimonadales bacterium]|nr:pyridoxamine 5'-phosphate oxidase family protein [Candidatus Saccharimonadales bacterium]
MNIETIIRDHISSVMVMQLATAAGSQPWLCNVHFAYDDDLNLYWLSEASTRHSREIAENPHVAAAMAVHTTMPLIGVQIEGDAVRLENLQEHEAVLHIYAKRHNREAWVEKLLSDNDSPFGLYKLAPRLIATFDLKNFPDAPKQEWRL